MYGALRRSLMLLAAGSVLLMVLVALAGCSSSTNSSIFYSVKDRATWSPNAQIIFASYGGNGVLYLWTIRETGGDGDNLTPTDNDDDLNDEGGWQPDLNATGDRLAFVAKRAGNWDLYLTTPTIPNSPSQLTTDTGVDQQPKWAPNGQTLAFSSNRSGNYDIWIINADGTGLQQITTDPGDDEWPYWSADGTQLVFQSDRAGNEDIFLINADGTGETQLTHSPGDDGAPAWGPSILFHTDRGGDYDIYEMTTTPDSETPLIVDPRSEGFPNWGPGGTTIVFTRQSAVWRAAADGTDQRALTRRFQSTGL